MTAAVYAVWLLVCVILQRLLGKKYPVRNVLFYSFLGIASMVLLNLLSPFTGVAVPVSRLSIAMSLCLGVFGTVGGLLINTFV